MILTKLTQRGLQNMFSFHGINQTIGQISASTTSHKLAKLTELSSRLSSISSQTDLHVDTVNNLLNFCKTCILDPKFTYKQISLFGLLSSRSENVVRQLMAQLDNKQIIYIFLQKFESALERANLADDFLKQVIQCIQSKDYAAANAAFQQIISLINQSGLDVPNAIDFASCWISDLLGLQIQLSSSKMYTATRWPVVEIDSSQRVYDLKELTHLMSTMPKDKVISFTYAIDSHHNVLLSLGADTSYHINLCDGNPVFGAGEVYLRNSGQNIEVVLINNKSGLYLPEDEFLSDVKHW